jgi:hypothetical protein
MLKVIAIWLTAEARRNLLFTVEVGYNRFHTYSSLDTAQGEICKSHGSLSVRRAGGFSAQYCLCLFNVLLSLPAYAEGIAILSMSRTCKNQGLR